MLGKLIDLALGNRFIVILNTLFLIALGGWAMLPEPELRKALGELGVQQPPVAAGMDDVGPDLLDLPRGEHRRRQGRRRHQLLALSGTSPMSLCSTLG